MGLMMEFPLVSRSATIREAVETIDQFQLGFCLVLDSRQRLVGTATDGDFRRGLIDGRSIDEPVDRIMNEGFVSVQTDTLYPAAYALAMKLRLKFLPVVSADGKLEDVLLWGTAVSTSRNTPTLGVVMAGGLGSRMGSLTSYTPKPLLQVLGVPLIDYAIASLARAGVERVIVSVKHMAEMVAHHVGNGSRYGLVVETIEESSPLGTAGALAEIGISEPESFFLVNADVLHDFDLLKANEFHLRSQAELTICATQKRIAVPYGVIEEQDGRVVSITEKPDYVSLVSTGVYVVSPTTLGLIQPGERTDITDVADRIIRDGGRVGAHRVEGYWRDIGTPEALRLANEELSSLELSPGQAGADG